MKDNQAAFEEQGLINNVDQLRRAIEKEWEDLTMEEINRACARMTVRIQGPV